MPIYNYGCTVCEHRFSVHAKISDPPLTTCPACGESCLRKLVSRAGFRLKGGGWYEQGYAGGSAASESKSDDS